ncbi:MAG: nucleotidyltransferase family protein [Burkholderiales bacterium]|nr:nucleotidyltransferase family protein [Anaerolineae bacterium]
MLNLPLVIPYTTLENFCQLHHIHKLSLFGSILRDDFSPDSDIDVLVEFEPEHIPGWEFVTMQAELTELLGREVDLHTLASLNDHFRHKVLAGAQVIYERA